MSNLDRTGCPVCERPMVYGPGGWKCGWAGCVGAEIITETAVARVVIEIRPTADGRTETYAYLWRHDAFTPFELPQLVTKMLGDGADILGQIAKVSAARAAARN